MTKVKIGIVTNPPSPATDAYRGVGAFHYLDGHTLADGRTLEMEYIYPDELFKGSSLWYKLFTVDMIIVQRPNGSMVGLLAEARRMGKTIVSDIDDHLLWLPKGNPAREHFNRQDVRQTVMQSLTTSDAIIFSTEKLKEIYSPHLAGKRSKVIPNGLNDYIYHIGPIPATSRPVRFAWRGSSTHLMDVHDVRKAFIYLRSSENSHITYYGYENPFDPVDGGYTYQRWAGSFFAYLQQLRDDTPDWMIVPLQDNDFNQGKSNIAWIEATYAGAAVLAPRGFPEFDQPGITHYRSEAELIDLIRQIEAGEIDKHELVQQSAKHIQKNYLLSRSNGQRLELLNELICKKVST